MLNETIYIDGVDVRTFGVHLQRPLSVSGIVPIVEEITVPGRNGMLTHYTGSYENREALAECFALSQDNVQQNISAFSSFLFSKKGYRKLQTSTDEEHYLMARVVNGAQIDDRLRKLNPFEIQFSCMPQRFLNEGDNGIDFYEGMESILHNPYGGETKPLLIVEGYGVGTVEINGVSISFVDDVPNKIFIDCETENAYSENGENLNRVISVKEFPTLHEGTNEIRLSSAAGLEKLTIVPRWWEK